jgi:hypothetical protein
MVFRHFAPNEAIPTLVGGVLILSAISAFFVYASRGNADNWVPILVAVNLLVIGYLICRWLSDAGRDKRLFTILMFAFILKLLCTGPRYYLLEGVYSGEGDAFGYDIAGRLFVDNVRHHGQWSIEGSQMAAFPRETRFVAYLTGCLFLLVGTTYFGAFLLYAMISWLGIVCFFRAYRIAYPNAPPYLAAKLLFFLPSTLFWPSSPGKEGVMVFFIGLFTLGMARLLTRTNVVLGAIQAFLGAYLMLQVRPHLMLISMVAVGASMLSVTEARDEVTKRSGRVKGAAFRIVMLLLLVPALSSSLGRLDTLMGTQEGGTMSIDQSLNETIARTEIGGSAFKTRPVRTPVDLPAAIVTVLYRPFPFEAHNVPALIASSEGVLLLVLTVKSGRWIWRVGPAMYRNQFAAFCGVYVLGFVVAFSNIGNAGILSRQRTQMFPLLLLVACAAKEHERTHTPPTPVLETIEIA